MLTKRTTIQFCGFGGQGIILSSIVLGMAAVTKVNLYAVQTQSYGSEARGGECQAELILSQTPINSPISDSVDILVAMSQPALNTYLSRLRMGGTLVFDPELVTAPERSDITIIPVHATREATRLGLKLAANMVMLGFIRDLTSLVAEDDLLDVIKTNVPKKYEMLNLEAARCGMAIARLLNIQVEV
jgi:2-oxoglutarate ferredoxin oxidoreductase subunit gamma